MRERFTDAPTPSEGGQENQDLFEQFRHMSMPELSKYAYAFNIYISHTDKQGQTKEGCLVGFMDMEKSPENLQVIVDREIKYWPQDGTTFVRAEKRQWKTIH